MDSFDISRVGFDPLKHYSGVRMQQGRVVTDDDHNEASRIGIEDQRRDNKHIIGPSGSPDNGFVIKDLKSDEKLDFNISPGTIYIGGLRFDMEPPGKDHQKGETYRSQRDWLQQPSDCDKVPALSAGQERYDLVYLEGWQQAVSAVEDSELFEVALGGPDTSVRIRNMRRVKVCQNIGSTDCAKAWRTWKNQQTGSMNHENELVRDVQLKVTYFTDPKTDNLCSPSVAGGYLGAENQAIRVQLTDKNHFTWGFDNASPLYRVKIRNKTVTILTAIKDQHHWPLAGQVVEIIPWSAVLPNCEKIAATTGFLSKVETSFNPDSSEIKLLNEIPQGFGEEWINRGDKNDLLKKDNSPFYFLRIWNRGTDLSSDTSLKFVANVPIKLGNTGLEVTIKGDDRINGDYWVIAARPSAPDEVVPWKLEEGVKPHGIRRYYAPLAIIQWSLKNGHAIPKVITDCRRKFPPLTNIKADDVSFDNSACHLLFANAKNVQGAIDALCKRQCSCTVSIVPGDDLMRIFSMLQANADMQDLHICFKVGIYRIKESIDLKNKGNIKFSGSGQGTQIIAENTESAFMFENCKDVIVSDISVVSLSAGFKRKTSNKNLNGTLTFKDCPNVIIEHVKATCSDYNRRAATCITVRYSEKMRAGCLSIRHSKFIIGGNQVGILAINARRAYIEDNQVYGIDGSLKSPANQGIVIAGTFADDVNIIYNRIYGVTQGIHIGTSQSEKKPGTPVSAKTVLISGNYIQCYSPILDNSLEKIHYERHGIFVGNVNSLVIINNYVEVIKSRKKLAFEGIRIYGNLGHRIIVRHNHLSNCGTTKGIYIHVLNSDANSNNWPKPLWIASENVASVLVYPSKNKFIQNLNFA